jgi:hypothetical protein
MVWAHNGRERRHCPPDNSGQLFQSLQSLFNRVYAKNQITAHREKSQSCCACAWQATGAAKTGW